jgi:hypothetical protein
MNRRLGRLVFVMASALTAACGDSTLRESDATRMITDHPRFRAGQTLFVPGRYCGDPPANNPPVDPGNDPRHELRELEQNQIITIEHRPATAQECRSGGTMPRELFIVSLTNVASTFHPTALENGRGWTFVLARRRFVKLDAIDYNSEDPPTMAHVQYAWAWEPQLIGQLLKVGSVVQGASATFVRDNGEWVVRQPGM